MSLAKAIVLKLHLTKSRTLLGLVLVSLAGFSVCGDLDDEFLEYVEQDDIQAPCVEGAACKAGVGECRVSGVLTCLGGVAQCDASPGEPREEICDGKDNDCDGVVDEGFQVGESCVLGVGVCARTGKMMCQPMGFSACDVVVGEPTEADETTCDDLDNDCDGIVDEGCDKDGDGFCDAERVVVGTPAACPQGGGDCMDSSAAIYPGAPEFCNGLDNDCDGLVDNDPVDPRTFYADCDGDNYAMLDAPTFVGCQPPPREEAKALCNDFYWARWVTQVPQVDDCHDFNYEVHPNQAEYFAQPMENPVNELSFDYDCSGAHDHRWQREFIGEGEPCPDTIYYTHPVGICGGMVNPEMGSVAGWVGEMPDCGESAAFSSCSYTRGSGNMCTGVRRISTLVQECR